MKTRQSFVSNSSSSSFILAVEPEVKEITAKIQIELDSICDSKKAITSIEQFEKYLLEESGEESLEVMLKDRDWWKKIYDAGIKALESGKVLRTGYVTNEGSNPENLELFIYDKGLEGLNCNEIEIVKEVAI
jgi:hypothetical protein